MKKTDSQKSVAGGFTLIEMMIVVAITAVLAAIAIPSFNDFFAKTRVKSAAEEIYGLILQAKSEAPIRDTDVFVNTNTAASWCVGFATTAGCDCTNSDSCVVNIGNVPVTQIVNGTEFTGVTIAETFANGTGTTFSRIRGGALSAGSITVASGDWALRVIVSVPGRIRVCNPNNNAMTGYGPCQ